MGGFYRTFTKLLGQIFKLVPTKQFIVITSTFIRYYFDHKPNSDMNRCGVCFAVWLD